MTPAGTVQPPLEVMYDLLNTTTVRPCDGVETVFTSVYVTVPVRVRLVPLAGFGASLVRVAEFSLKS